MMTEMSPKPPFRVDILFLSHLLAPPDAALKKDRKDGRSRVRGWEIFEDHDGRVWLEIDLWSGQHLFSATRRGGRSVSLSSEEKLRPKAGERRRRESELGKKTFSCQNCAFPFFVGNRIPQ